jgi:hypothetical protein
MILQRTRLSGLLAAVLALTAGAQAGSKDASDPYARNRSENEQGSFRYDDSRDIPWREDSGPVQVPPPPEDGTLGQLQLDNLPRSFTAFLDTKTLAVNPVDGVLRYWLVLRSGSSSTISYEGMSCRSREYKIYGFADPREPSGVRLVREPKWQPLGFSRRNDFRWELADSYLCLGIEAKSNKDVLSSIRGHYERANPFAEYRDNARPFVP